MAEDLHSDLVTEFTRFTCYFDNQEGTLDVAGHVVEFKSKYSDRNFDIPTDRIRVFKSKKEPKLKLDKQPKEEEGRATEKNTESFLLTFANPDDCEKCKELIAKYMTLAEKRKKQTHEGNKQLKLLASDPFLKKVYDEMVGGGIIKKEEFWAQRKYLISSSALTADSSKGGSVIKEQREGLKNYLFCSDDQIKSSAVNDRETTIILSKRTIQQIFTEHPGVYEYYKKVVPSSMNEKEFWAKFMKSYFFRTLDPVHTAMGNTTSAYSRTDVDDALDHYERKTNKEFDETAKKAVVNPLVNLAAEDQREGYGLRPDELVYPSKLAGFPESLKNLNRKSARITQYAFSTKAGDSLELSSQTKPNDIAEEEKILRRERERMKELLDFEDLKTEASVEYIPLKIQDKNRYFEGLLNEATTPLSGTISKKITVYPLKDMRLAFNEEISHLKEKLNLQSVIIDPNLAVTIYKEISNQIIQSGDREDKTLGGILNKTDVEYQFRELFEIIHELLRHLWSMLSLTKSDWKPFHTERSQKIVQKLTEKRDQMKKLANVQTNQWIKSLTDSINIALEHFENRMNPGRNQPPQPGTPLSSSQNITIAATTPQQQQPQQPTQQGTPLSVNPFSPSSTQTPAKPVLSVNLSKTPSAATTTQTPTPSSTPVSAPAKKIGFSLPSSKGASTTTPPSSSRITGFKGFELKKTSSSSGTQSSPPTTNTSDVEPAQKKIKTD